MDKTSCVHPADILRQKAASWGCSVTDAQFAMLMDEEDPVRELRHMFHYPKKGHLPKVDPELIDPEEESVYLCGNSLGLEPKGARACIERELDKWAKWGVHGHFMGEMPWATCDECVDAQMAELVGAKRAEVAVMNGLTVNQHLLLISFYRPTPERYKVLIEDHSFPSDHYAVESQIRLHGYDPKECMICLKPRQGEHCLRLEDIEDVIEKEGDSIAVIMFPGVQYYTGQLFNMKAIAKAGHAKGIYVGFDLAHAVGNVEIFLRDWNVDFACWCTYKYLNTGAGGIAGIYINEKYANNDFPKLHGWWSHKMETRFKMTNELDLPPGAAGYRISNPPPLLCCTLEASLEVFGKTSMKELRTKSKLLTGYLELLLKHYFPVPPEGVTNNKPSVQIITPRDPDQRGAQLSVMFSVSIVNVATELSKRGAVFDKREPDVLRLSPAPLYNTFNDVYRFMTLLRGALQAIQ